METKLGVTHAWWSNLGANNGLQPFALKGFYRHTQCPQRKKPKFEKPSNTPLFFP
jgi:hypothetical protein